jgi:S-adenosylmethionine hydrolase
MGMQAVYAFTNNSVLPTNISPTFHGRDIFAPVAVNLAKGAHPSELGGLFHTYENLDFGQPVYGADYVSGEIIYIDKFGNFITNIPRNMVPLSFGEMISIRIGEFDETIPFVTSYGEVMPNTYLLTVSSSGLFEIACRNQSAFRELEKNVGCDVVMRF